LTYSVILTRRAQRDLMKLYGYIAEQSGESRADGYIDRIQKFASRFAQVRCEARHGTNSRKVCG